jgi:hypothetical protein
MIRLAHPSAKAGRNRLRHALSEGLILLEDGIGHSSWIPDLGRLRDGLAYDPVCAVLRQSQFDFFPVLAGSGARATPHGSYFLSGSGIRSSADL